MRGSEFADLKSFVAVAERASFSRAAADLNVTPSALSQTVRQLERRLGARLLNRTTRSVALTDAGAKLHERMRVLFTQFDDVIAETAGPAGLPSGRVRISLPRAALAGFVLPILGDFHRAYPQIELEIAVDDVPVDIVAGHYDAGIRLGESVEKDMIAVKLSGEFRAAIIGGADYLAQRGEPIHPSDLSSHACIRFRWPGSGAIYHWEFDEDGRTFEVMVDGPLIVNDVSLMVAAAVDNVGLAYVLESDAQPALAAGKVRPLLTPYCAPFPGFYLYHSTSRQMPPALRALIDFLIERRKS